MSIFTDSHLDRTERQVRRMMDAFYRPWYRRPLPWLALLLVILAGGRLALTPLADRTARQALSELPSFHVRYQALSFFSFPPVALMDGVTIDGLDGKRVVSIERVEAHATWQTLARAAFFNEPPTVRLRIIRPVVTLAGDTPVFLASEIEAWTEGRRTARIELASVEQGKLLVGDRAGAQSEPWLTDVAASYENLRPGEAPIVKGHAALLGSGEAAFHLDLPQGEAQPVTGQLSVSYLSLADLYLFIGSAPTRNADGTVALSARFSVFDGQVSGTLRTSSVGVYAGDLPEAQVAKLRTRLSGAAPFVAGRRLTPRGSDHFVFRGTLSPAGSRPWVQALAISRSLFVEGISGAMSTLPTTSEPASGEAVPATQVVSSAR